MSIDSLTKRRAEEYIRSHHLTITDEMGSGYDGVVYSTSRPSAVKALKYEKQYRTEKAVYIRLGDNGIEKIEGFSVPKLIHFDDDLWCIEMEIVTRPYVLDFAGAYIDEKPPYEMDELVMSEWLAAKQEDFGERWGIVSGVMAVFRRYGIYLSDIRYGNIEF